MSIRHNTVMRERDLVAGCNRDSSLKEVFLSKGTIVDIASQITSQESCCFVALLVFALLLWLISRKQKSDRRQTEEDREKDSNERTLTTKIPPGTSGWPFIGETIDFILDGRKFFRTRRTKYGSVFRSHLCGLPAVVIVGAENVQKVLTASESSLVQSPPPSFLKLFGRGALSSTVGRRHSQLQRSTVRLFTPRNLSHIVAPVQKVIRGHIARWRGAPDVVNGSDACREMSLSVVYQCFFGFDLEQSEASRITELFQTFSDGVFAFPVNLPGFAFHRAMVAREAIRRLVSQSNHSSSSFSSSSSSSFLADKGNSRSSPLAMLDLLQKELGVSAADSGETTTIDDDACDLVLELLFGGHESTASAMCTALVEMSEQESILEKIRSELRQLGVAPGDFVDYETLRRLTYTSDVVKEVLRVQPPIAGAFRRTCKPFLIQDYVIPAGWIVLYGITDTHEASSAFDDVQKFNPDRWKNVRVGRISAEKERTSVKSQEERDGKDETIDQIQEETDHTTDQTRDQMRDQSKDQPTTVRIIGRYEYLPFGGGGKRFCVGESLARMILSIYVVELANGTNGWRLVNGRPQIKTAPIPFPKDNLPLLFNAVRSN